MGYDKISLLSAGLFLSPYSITTIREYFATGLLDFLLGEDNHLKDVSPVLYEKINEVIENLEK